MDLSQWISQAEAARIRGVTRQAISKLISKGKLNILEVGGRVFVNRQDLLDYKDGNAGRPKPTDSQNTD